MTETVIGPFDQTWFANVEGFHIERIRPYAAWDVIAEKWIVEPPDLPTWSINDLPKPYVTILRAAEATVRNTLKLPEPDRTLQAARLYDMWHADRSNAFGPQGEGWYDLGNLREKWLDQLGLWGPLAQAHHRAVTIHLDDWSNMPSYYLVPEKPVTTPKRYETFAKFRAAQHPDKSQRTATTIAEPQQQASDDDDEDHHQPLYAHDLSTPDARRSRAVSHEEFQTIARRGAQKFAQMHRDGAEPHGLDQNWHALVHHAYHEARRDWGGVTINAHTGELVHPDADAYALTTRHPDAPQVSVPHGADEHEFGQAMNRARQVHADSLRHQGAHLGVFHDNDRGRIDIDPVTVVHSLHDVEDIGAHTRATGGAYHFQSGDGFWPPHVAPQSRTGAALEPHQDAVYRAHNAMRESGKDLYHYMNHLQVQDMGRTVLTEHGHPHGDKLLISKANPGRSYVKYDTDNNWPRIGLADNHLNSHAVFHELAHVLTNTDHESEGDDESHGPAYVHTFRGLLSDYGMHGARQVFDENYRAPHQRTAASMYHWAPRDARDDIAEHGLDHTRSPHFDPAASDVRGTFLHHTRELADDWVPDIAHTHDLYAVDTHGLSLRPDPYDTGDASYTPGAVEPGRLRRISAYQHRPAGPPRPEDHYQGGQPAHDLDHNRSGVSMYGDGSSPGSRFRSRTLDDKADAPTARVLRQARGNPAHPITMYRALPHEHVESGFRPGDWVTLSKSYAQNHARGNGYAVVKATVPAKHLWTDGDYNEWGYHGEAVQGQVHTTRRTSGRSDPHHGVGPWFHGTNADLKPGDVLTPGDQQAEKAHGRYSDGTRVWISNDPWRASAYGHRTFAVEPHSRPRSPYANHDEHHTTGATVLHEVDREGNPIGG